MIMMKFYHDESKDKIIVAKNILKINWKWDEVNSKGSSLGPLKSWVLIGHFYSFVYIIHYHGQINFISK